MTSGFTELAVEDAALAWLGELEFAVAHGPHIAPGELATGMDGHGRTTDEHHGRERKPDSSARRIE